MLLSSRPALILDRRCPHLVINLSASIFGKKARELTFSKEGIMTGFSMQATSGAGALLDVAAGLPASVASALEQSTNIATRIGTLRTSALDQEIARNQKEVELKEQELALAGINATGGYVRRARAAQAQG